MLSIFIVFIYYLCFVFGKIIYSHHLPISLLVCLIFVVELYDLYIYSQDQPLFGYVICKYFPPFCGLPTFDAQNFNEVEVFRLLFCNGMLVSAVQQCELAVPIHISSPGLFVFVCVVCAFGVMTKKSFKILSWSFLTCVFL